MGPDIHRLGESLLRLRMEYDPLDDAFRTLEDPPSGLPRMNEGWIAEMQSKLATIEDRLPAHSRQPDAIDADILTYQARELGQKLTMRLWATFVSGYDHSPLGRVTGVLPSLDAHTAAERAAVMEVVASIGPYIEACADGTVDAARAGRAPLRASLDDAVGAWRNLLEAEGLPLVPTGSPEALKEDVRDRFLRSAAPSIRRYVDLLTGPVRPLSRPDDKPGMCHLALGEEQYEQLIDTNTDGFGSADRIHAYGLSEVSRLREEVAELLGKSCNPEQPIGDLLASCGTDDRYATADEFMAEVTDLLQSAPAEFSDTVDLDCLELLSVDRIPAHLSASSPVAYYLPGGAGGNPGKMMINPERMVGEPRGSAQAMLYHEAIPGHHAQFEYARRAPLPRFRRSAWFNAFIEGWGLYAEELAEELGLYRTTSAKIGKAKLALFRAARLVVDTGLHAKGWTVAQAQDYLVFASGLGTAAAASEIRRYIEFPAQALSYATGKARILDVRETARSRQGAAFDLRDFHSKMLRHGTAPISSIAARL